MKAIPIEQYGGPEVLLRQEIDIPKPKHGEVLVKVICAGINFMDIHTRQGKYRTSRTYPVRIPCTLGTEGSREVVETGAGVKTLAPGDRVAWCISWGAYAEYAVLPAARLARIPDEIPYDLAAAAIFQGSTAHYLVEDVGHLEAGSTCLIHAASGGIGQLLVQLAKRRGATVFATTSTEAKADIARKLGADHVMVYDEGRFADRVREATHGKGVDVVYDAVGGELSVESMRCTRFGARFLIVGWASTPLVARGGRPANQLPTNLIMMKGLDVLGCPAVISATHDPSLRAPRLRQILAWAEAGELRPLVSRSYPLDEFRDAMRAKWNGEIAGGCVLHP
jgi:NADPH:quinone reductase